MLKRNFDPDKRYRYVEYLRMSSDKQNPRSPEQQSNTIQSTLKSCGRNWEHVASFTDAGKSGRTILDRPELQRMLQEIRSGKLPIDLILVDTYERLGRADEITVLRREMDEQYGVLVLTADTQFCDPTSVAGRAVAAIESIRSTEDGRIKAHNVLRGKIDAVKLGHWAGGPPPFGYMCQKVHGMWHNKEHFHSILVPNPKTAPIIVRLFAAAAEKGWGSSRLARMLTNDPTIPACYKPFNDATVLSWLKNSIYMGEYVFNKECTGIASDRRVSQRNPVEDLLKIPGYCEPIVTPEIWLSVERLRRVRAERMQNARAKKAQTDKLYTAAAPGLPLKYLLSGLVVCDHCDGAMVLTSTSPYTTKAGVENRYPRYVCRNYLKGCCENSTGVPEPWLREKVLELLLKRLFASSDTEGASGTSSDEVAA